MAKRNIKATGTPTHITITIERKTAARMAELLDTTGDWFGNMEAGDGLTTRDIERGVSDIEYLTELLGG